MSPTRPASMSAWSQLSPSTGYGEPVIRTVVAAGLGSSLVLFGGLHTLSPHIIAQAGLPPSSTPKRPSRPLSVPLYPVRSPFSEPPPSATPRHRLSADIMGNCHSKSDDHRHGGRDGYSSSTEKLNPRPYNPNNPNSTINYTKNKIVINAPPGQATASQRQQQQQFSSPPKGKRRVDPKPEYYLRVGCRICKNKCKIAPDFDIQRAKFYQDPLYRGPMKEWQLELDFCDLVTSFRESSRQQDGPAFLKLQKEKGWPKTPQQVLERFVKDPDFRPVGDKPSGPMEVKKLLDELTDGEVKFSSSL